MSRPRTGRPGRGAGNKRRRRDRRPARSPHAARARHRAQRRRRRRCGNRCGRSRRRCTRSVSVDSSVRECASIGGPRPRRRRGREPNQPARARALLELLVDDQAACRRRPYVPACDRGSASRRCRGTGGSAKRGCGGCRSVVVGEAVVPLPRGAARSCRFAANGRGSADEAARNTPRLVPMLLDELARRGAATDVVVVATSGATSATLVGARSTGSVPFRSLQRSAGRRRGVSRMSLSPRRPWPTIGTASASIAPSTDEHGTERDHLVAP